MLVYWRVYRFQKVEGEVVFFYAAQLEAVHPASRQGQRSRWRALAAARKAAERWKMNKAGLEGRTFPETTLTWWWLFQIFVMFTPNFGEDEPILTKIFKMD